MTEKQVVMHIEDNPAHAELIRRLLVKERPDVCVRQFSDGEAALDYLRHSPLPALLLLDLRLPGISGGEILDIIKNDSRLQSLPVVILSTSSAWADVEAAYCSHADCYLIKPVEFESTRKMMVSVCRFWLDNLRPGPAFAS